MSYAAFGDLDRDGTPDAAVITVTSPGGSGVFRDLHVMVSRDKKAESLAYVSLGDRVKVESLMVENHTIIIELLEHGPDDAMCCPTKRKRYRYVVENEQLVEKL